MDRAQFRLRIDHAGLARMAELVLSEGMPCDRSSPAQLIADRLGPYGARPALFDAPIERYFAKLPPAA